MHSGCMCLLHILQQTNGPSCGAHVVSVVSVEDPGKKTFAGKENKDLCREKDQYRKRDEFKRLDNRLTTGLVHLPYSVLPRYTFLHSSYIE